MGIKVKNDVSKNAILLIILSFLLKGIGFVNRIIIAYKFGTTVKTDLFYISSGFVDSISSVLLASLTVGIVNIYIEHRGNKKETEEFLNRVLLIVETFMLLFMLGSIIFSGSIAKILAPGYSEILYNELSNSLKIVSFSYLFLGITSVLCAGLQAEEVFIPGKLTGAIASAISIIIVIFFSDILGYKALIFAYNLTALINSIFILFCSKKLFVIHFVDIKGFFDKNIKHLIKLSTPLLVGLAAHELNLIIDKSVATSLEKGAVSALAYSSVLYLFIENIIINSIVTAVFPHLSKLRLEGKEKILAERTKNYIFFSEIILIPIVIVIYLQSVNIVEVIYMRGGFKAHSLLLTSAALSGYIVGLPFLALRDLLTHVYYAYGYTKEPMIINLCSIMVNIILDVVLSRYMGIKGITLATTISLIFCSIVMLCRICKINFGFLLSFSKLKCFEVLVGVGTIFTICKFIKIENNILSILINLIVVLLGEFIIMYVVFPEKIIIIKSAINNFLGKSIYRK